MSMCVVSKSLHSRKSFSWSSSWFGLCLVMVHARSSFLSYMYMLELVHGSNGFCDHGLAGLDKPRGRTLKCNRININRRGLKLQNSTWLGRPHITCTYLVTENYIVTKIWWTKISVIVSIGVIGENFYRRKLLTIQDYRHNEYNTSKIQQ